MGNELQSATVLLQSLKRRVQRPLKVRINDNRSTMVSIRWIGNEAQISLHRMFLRAPTEVLEGVATYIRGSRSRGAVTLSPIVRQYIDHNLRVIDYSHTIDPARLVTEGKAFDLAALYRQVNKEYFNSALDLNITWFGESAQRNRTRITYGLYQDATKLIKIHRVLDRLWVPKEVILFVIYHEMLHHLCPPERLTSGQHSIHTPKFRAREALFKHYDYATEWLKDFESRYFSGAKLY